ncbi:hypothetical protein [Saccharothrix sp. NRRL B-16348]|uniref:hypothetical protein n=1 Tax=Saccharothrix sp. NRRL B-16348 TaxID=1415542 RepID=UPI000A63A3A9|nr:hypothetical protein [Saccharothrix sp. NRRL B-16348]
MDFEPTPVERKLQAAVAVGGRVAFDADGRPIRGNYLSSILLKGSEEGEDGEDGEDGVPRLLELSNAPISGVLDLEAGTVTYPVEFINCDFDVRPNLEQARIDALYLTDCRFPGLRCAQLTTRTSVEVKRGASSGRVDFIGAHIGGQLRFTGISLVNHEDEALCVDGAVIGQDMACAKGFVADGAVRMVGVRVGGQLSFEGGAFNNPGRRAIEAASLCVGEDLLMHDGCKVDGEVDFTGCAIGGRAVFTGGIFINRGRTALDLARARISQNVEFCNGFVAYGRIVLSGAVLLGSIRCKGGHFENPNATAIAATGVVVERDAEFEGLVAEGAVDLTGAHIKGNVNFSNAQLTNALDALQCDRMKVDQDAIFDRCNAQGRIRMYSARIAGQLSFVNTSIGDVEDALTLKGTVVAGPLRMKFGGTPVGGIDLYQVKVAHLDDRESKWPARVRLDEFVYGAIADKKPDVKERVKWLKRNPEPRPQIYMQLASVYESLGQYGSAKKVLIAGEEARSHYSDSDNLLRRALTKILGVTVGYGYRPLRVLVWMAALVLLGWILFGILGIGRFVPIQSLGPGVKFQPLVYTLDLVLPVVNLKQRDFWIPQGAALIISTALTVLGWVLAICLVTGLGKAFKREL